MFTPNATQYPQASLFTTHPARSPSPVGAKESNGASFVNSDRLTDQKKAGMERILEKVEEDKRFAKEMVEFYKSTPDRPIFNLEEALSSPGGLAHIQDKISQFNAEANKVSDQREEIYRSMRANNYDDAEIFKALMVFNNSLPDDYKQAAGIVSVNIRV